MDGCWGVGGRWAGAVRGGGAGAFVLPRPPLSVPSSLRQAWSPSVSYPLTLLSHFLQYSGLLEALYSPHSCNRVSVGLSPPSSPPPPTHTIIVRSAVFSNFLMPLRHLRPLPGCTLQLQVSYCRTHACARAYTHKHTHTASSPPSRPPGEQRRGGRGGRPELRRRGGGPPAKRKRRRRKRLRSGVWRGRWVWEGEEGGWGGGGWRRCAWGRCGGGVRAHGYGGRPPFSPSPLSFHLRVETRIYVSDRFAKLPGTIRPFSAATPA